MHARHSGLSTSTGARANDSRFPAIRDKVPPDELPPGARHAREILVYVLLDFRSREKEVLRLTQDKARMGCASSGRSRCANNDVRTTAGLSVDLKDIELRYERRYQGRT